MQCPKCGHKQELSDTCAGCGIIFAKYHEIQKRKAEPASDSSKTETPPPQKASDFFSSFREQAPWSTVSTPAMIGLSLGFAVVSYLLATTDLTNTGSSLILFMVHNVNLVFHEAGHWIFGIFGNETLTILGGSLNQVLIPFIVVVAFWRQREAAGFAFGMFWMFESLIDVSVYMADARALELPLLGGLGDDAHDWRNLFMHWGLLAKDTLIAGYVRKIGWTGIVSIWMWLVWRWFVDRGKSGA